MGKIQHKATKISRFLSTGMWRAEESEPPRNHPFFIQIMHIISIAVRKFITDNCALRASALTFYSLLSVVPVIALAFGIAKGFGLEKHLEQQLYERLIGQEEVLEKIITFARSLLENSKGGLVAGIGVAVLLWSAIYSLRNIEDAFNKIWRSNPRSFIRRFTDYLAIMIAGPLLIIISSSVTVYITTQVAAMTGELGSPQIAGLLIFWMVKLLPFCLIWLLFIMVYTVLPNTRVRFLSSVIAGVVAGTIFQVFQGVYISAQVLLTKYNAIYGSFAALPLFMIWLQFSWMIALFGAQIGYAHQHISNDFLTVDNRKASPLARKIYGMTILKYLIACFERGDPSPSAVQVSASLRLPLYFVVESLQRLKACGLVSEIAENRSNSPTFQPARDIQTISVSFFLSSWEHQGQPPVAPTGDSEISRIEMAMVSVDDAFEQSPANRLIKDL